MSTFLLWLAWMVCGSLLVLGLLFISGWIQERALRSRIRALRCPDCGGGYDLGSIVWVAPTLVLRNPAPGMKLLPRAPPPTPSFKVTCAVCGHVTEYDESGPSP
ncbi:hypothetical protein GCM10012319_72570 [Comamonas sp. KCTC 72670]|nr:hypothetical protein GCM10012319_72570 [Comamonas sp. KCTC 72670]